MTTYPIEISQTASGGEWSFNSLNISNGFIYHILVKASNTDTTFNVTITDDKDNVIYDTLYDETTATGTLNERIMLPVRGIITIAVANSSVATDTFTGRIMVVDT